MKRIGIFAITASLLAGSAIPAQAMPAGPLQGPGAGLIQAGWPGNQLMDKDRNDKNKKHSDHGHHDDWYKKNSRYHDDHHRPHWKSGQKYGDWRRHQEVDWRRHHLRQPGPGQRWVQVDDQYLLISTLTGVIAGALLAGQ